eukprot:361814-Chlamydomonas_euryale.AAC.3
MLGQVQLWPKLSSTTGVEGRPQNVKWSYSILAWHLAQVGPHRPQPRLRLCWDGPAQRLHRLRTYNMNCYQSVPWNAVQSSKSPPGGITAAVEAVEAVQGGEASAAPWR